jgi:hypothetical protein
MTSMQSYSFSNIDTLQADLRAGKVSAGQITQQCISLAKEKKQLNAFL